MASMTELASERSSASQCETRSQLYDVSREKYLFYQFSDFLKGSLNLNINLLSLLRLTNMNRLEVSQ